MRSFGKDIKDAFHGKRVGLSLMQQWSPEVQAAIDREVERRSPKPPQTMQEKLVALGKFIAGACIITIGILALLFSIKLIQITISFLF